MDQVSVDLKFCYGIKSLNYVFTFPHGGRAYAIYAPNGAMKSSFALTFKALSEKASGAQPRDRIFPDNPTVADVKDENGNDIENERILVALSYDKDLGPSERTCTLLVDDKLRTEFAELQRRVNEAEQNLTDLLKRQSKSKTALVSEIPIAFAASDLRAAMRRIEPELVEQDDAPFVGVAYDKVFDPEFVKELNTNDLKTKIANYIDRYNELLDQSVFFSRGVFDYYNASQIATSLTKNGFFKAKHTINLKPSIGNIQEINTKDELEAVIEKEKQTIINDDKLVSDFSAIADSLDGNARLRGFRDYLMENRFIVPHLANVEQFRQEVIKSYIKSNYESYRSLLDTYASVRAKQEEIEEAAREQKTLWQQAIDTFNTRFRVPFTLTVKNQASVVMGRDKVMQLGFTYRDGARTAEFARDDLLEILSQGERRAFYLLNVIFEIKRREKDNQETLIIVDDIADSFDYQNKYAIVQYLADMSEQGSFKLIILTHNFDFFRTIESRFIVHRANCLMATKTDAGITLDPAVGVKDIFSRDWKKGFYTDDRKRISCIPFLRNLIELREGAADADYLKLTSMLHWKPDSTALTDADLDAIYVKVCGSSGGPSANPARIIPDLIFTTADALPAPVGLNLENKVVLAVAIRMRAEQYMVTKIANPAHWGSITSNQTPKLIQKFKETFQDAKVAEVLDRVALMTPENIHLNAFMYEPIIDMSEDHLRKLYADVKALP